MSYTLESLVDSIDAYARLEEEFGFYRHGDGEKPWSTRYVNVKGDCIDVRASDWTYYSNGIAVAAGNNPASLKAFLQGFEEIA